MMVYCESCGAANETVTQKCFVCQQPVVDTEELEIVLKRSLANRENGNRNEEKDTPALLQERYQIMREVGTGGFGAVYKAIDTKFDNRTVAIKEIRLQGLKPNEIIDATDTFNREVNILSDLRHPNLPRVYNHFTSPEYWYLVMDFIDGQTLAAYLDSRGGRLPLDDVFSLGIQVCTVLDYLHTREPAIIFRDLKPTNIMITSHKQVYLIDFGAARYFKAGRTKDTIAFGSPGYAAPEQYGKAQTTARSDIYSLGATLHEALTGKDPAEDPFHFSAVREASSALPPDLEALILRMVEMDMSKRPISAAAVKAELWRISTQHTHRLYALPAAPSGMPPYRPTFGVGQPPPPAWSKSAPSVQQAQIQLGFTPTPVSRKSGISRRAVTSVIILGIASVAFLENARSFMGNHTYGQPETQPESMVPVYTFKQQVTFPYHQNIVTSLDWSPEGDYIASGSLDKTLRIWNANFDGTETIHTMPDGVNAVGWSHDGAYVAAASGGKPAELQIWSASARGGDKPLHTYSKPSSGAINALAWSPLTQSNASVAIGSDDGNIRVIDVSAPVNQDIASTYNIHKEPVSSLAWSPYGNYLAGSAGTIINVQPINSNGLLASGGPIVFSQHIGRITALTWTADQNYVISGDTNMQILVWDLNGRVVQNYPTTAPVSAMALSSQNLLAVGTEDGTLSMYNLQDANEAPTIVEGNGAAIRSIVWSPDGTFFVVGGNDEKAIIWSAGEENPSQGGDPRWQGGSHRGGHWGG